MKQEFNLSGEVEVNESRITNFGGCDEVVIGGINIDGENMDLVLSGRGGEGFNLVLKNKKGLERKELKIHCYDGELKLQTHYDDGDVNYGSSYYYTKDYIAKGLGTRSYTSNIEDEYKIIKIPVPKLR